MQIIIDAGKLQWRSDTYHFDLEGITKVLSIHFITKVAIGKTR